MPRSVNEFGLISKYFTPLTNACAGALGLTDDAALVSHEPGYEIVVTCDALVCGVHFRSEDEPEDVAARALRVNLSDLAAMGSRPVSYLLALAAPADITETWLERFVAQLALDQKTYQLNLIGGDTVMTPGPLTLSITALGRIPKGQALTRAGAKAGDRIFVSGNIGDASLGLKLLRGELESLTKTQATGLKTRFLRPEPRIALGQALIGIAHAVTDVSDGLVADLGHICALARVGAQLNVSSIPLSTGARAALDMAPDLLPNFLSFGDDYELVFTAPAAARDALARIASSIGVMITEIGEVVDTPGVVVLDTDGSEIRIQKAGYQHF